MISLKIYMTISFIRGGDDDEDEEDDDVIDDDYEKDGFVTSDDEEIVDVPNLASTGLSSDESDDEAIPGVMLINRQTLKWRM